MRVLLINLEFDCAGVAWNLAGALRGLGHECKHVMNRPTYAARNTDVMFNSIEQVVSMCEWADVLHFNQWIWTHRPGVTPCGFQPSNEYSGASPFAPFLKIKRVVFHFHGGLHQLRPDYWVSECARVGARILKCDPITPIPGATWLPNVLDNIEARVDRNAPFRVAVMGALSDQRRNNQQIQAALKYVGMPHDFFGEIPRPEALQKRRQYAVTIDNLTQGFTGMWTWEALAMGQVPLARLCPEALMAYSAIGAGCPIRNVPNIDHAVTEILRLQSDPPACADLERQGIAWMRDNYRADRIAQMYVDFYNA